MQDTKQHVRARASFENVTLRYLHLEDVPLKSLVWEASSGGVYVGYWFAAERGSLANTARCKAAKVLFAAIYILLEDGKQFDCQRLISADDLRHVLKRSWHRLR